LACHSEERSDQESLFLLAFGQEELLGALAMTGLEAFFNKLLGKVVVNTEVCVR
jgi:hypothetical protein